MPVTDEMNIRIKVLKGNADMLIKGVGKSLHTVGGAMRKVTALAGPFGIAVGGAGMVLAFRSVIREASNFEKELSKVATLTDDVQLIFGDYAHEVEKLSVAYGQATTSLSKGLFDIVSAGIAASEAMDVLTASTELAVGGVTTAGIATSAMITTYQTFTDQLKDATDAADLLFAIQKKGRLTVEDVARTFGGIASTAKAANLSVEALGTAFAAISRGGEGAETSIVELRMVMEGFTKKTTPEAMAMARNFGFELKAATIEGDGLIDVIDKIKNASIDEIGVMFNQSRARRGVNNLIAQSSNLTDIYNGILNRAGENQKALNKQLETSDVQFQRFGEAVNKMKKIIGDDLVDDMEDLATSTADWMESIEGVETVRAFGTALNFVVGPAAQLSKYLAKMVPYIMRMRGLKEFRELEKEEVEDVIGGRGAETIFEKPFVVDPKSMQAALEQFNIRIKLARGLTAEELKQLEILNKRIDTIKLFKEENDIMREAASEGFRSMDQEAKDFAFNTSSRFENLEKDALNSFNIIDESIKNMAQSMQRNMDNFFFRVMKRDFENFGDFAGGVMDSILQSVASMMSQQVMSGFSTTAKAGGLGTFLQGVFTRNKMAKGDIANTPTPGIFGEAGRPEGVFPLRRDAKGNLGVSAVGGGDGSSADSGGSIIIVNTISPAAMVMAGLSDPQAKNIIINDISGDILRKGTVFKTLRKG